METLKVAILVTIMVGSGTAFNQTLEGDNLKDILSNFRKGVLGMVAINLNETVNATKELNTLIENCKPTLTTLTAECKSCAKDQCQESPSFLDYLNLANPYVYLKEPLDYIGGGLKTVGDLLGDDAGAFFNVLEGVPDAFEDFPDLAGDLFNNLKEELEKLKGKFKNFGNDIKDATDSLEDILGDLLPFKRRKRSASNLRELFGIEVLLRKLIERKLEQRSDLDPNVRDCMKNNCPPCKNLLLPTQQDIIGAVCGSEVIELNQTIQYSLLKIETAYNASLDETYPIVTKVVMDFSSLSNLIIEKVYFTVFNGKEYTTYQTGVEYPWIPQDVGPKRAGVEYWEDKVVV